MFLSSATAPSVIFTLSLHDALPIYLLEGEAHVFETDFLADDVEGHGREALMHRAHHARQHGAVADAGIEDAQARRIDRKSTRLNSSHPSISYAVFCLKKKKTKRIHT